MAFFIGTQFEPISRIRRQVVATGGEAMATVQINPSTGQPWGNPWDGTSGGLASSDHTQGGIVGQSVDMTSIATVPSVSPGGNPNPASTTFSVKSTFTNLVNTVIQDVTGFVPWIIIAVIAWFAYKHFFKHGR